MSEEVIFSLLSLFVAAHVVAPILFRQRIEVFLAERNMAVFEDIIMIFVAVNCRWREVRHRSVVRLIFNS